ncbi:MAG: BREX-2 system adenine-specific DNA-methyltransferase PglX [Mycobacteriales bacterium]
MSAMPALTGALRELVLRLQDDLRERVEGHEEVRGRWVVEHARALERGRTSAAWQTWRDDRVTQAAVGWVLTTVFVRFAEDNGLLAPVFLAGPESRRQEALDARLAYFRTHPEDTDREWLQQAVAHLASLPSTRALVDEHAALHLVAPSGDAASALLAFWQARGDDGRLVHDLADPSWDTRFLGDLYQDLSEHAKATYALLQTPEFVEEFILDRTLEPALRERPLEGFRMIDPTCGSGHFLLGAFARLLDRWHKEAPALEVQARVQTALDAVHGVDLNPFAVAIARFRLTVAALRECALTSLEDAPAFRLHLAVGDSLLHEGGQTSLDFGAAYDADAGLSDFVYATEDLVQLREILQSGRYDCVVGNPPYITVKDATLNAAYRQRYATCKGKYALSVPFMERFFGLARRGETPGWVGQITSNSFMKREFGSKLIEEFLVRQDLRLVADTSGTYIPGHGTPTVIVVGRPSAPVGDTVRAVLGVRGEPGRPDDPANGLVWRSIVEHVDQPGWSDGWLSVTELPLAALAQHPWSLSGGGASSLLAAIDVEGRQRLGGLTASIGFMAVTGDDAVFIAGGAPPAAWRRDAVPLRRFVEGDGVRDYELRSAGSAAFPYEHGRPLQALATSQSFWPFRSRLRTGLAFGRTREDAGKAWFEYILPNWPRLEASQLLVFSGLSTHNHFSLARGESVLNRWAPVIRLPEVASEDEHLALLGVLNSSAACFWLKQNSQNKGNGGIGGGIGDEAWEPRYEFTGTTLQDFPLPATLPRKRGIALDALAQRLSATTPASVCATSVPTTATLADARDSYDRLRAEMVAQQEELDWEVYRLYGLVDEDLTYPGDDLPPLALGERAFEIVLARKVAAGEEQTAWFARHGSTPITELPAHWPPAYRDLVQRRLDLIASDPGLRLLEKPEHKRRWASVPWDRQSEQALRGWLLDRLEDRRFWFDRQGRPSPRSVAQLADEVARDADLASVLALWEGRPDTSVAAALLELLADEVVPYLAAHRYKDSGLRKREAWKESWALQRREDAGEQVGVIPVPPKYTSADFRKTSYWLHRGKLDVPKERFVLYPDAGRDTDPTPLLGWAGWDDAQQGLALHTVIGEREGEGWDDERLVPLVAGLVERQPWVDQWHGGLDPALGYDVAAFLREELAARRAQVSRTDDQLRAWRPAAPTRGRTPRT